ncbi:MAG TPA: putative Ig domain-containing protein [Terriglobales bacterium]|nr:putative Ig domain-containing protein [Terriglobales bacterium]
MKRFAGAGLLSGLIVLALLVLSGCGSSAPPPMAVALSPSSTPGIDQAQTVPITATVSNDPKTAGVTWAVSGGGTLTGTTTAAATYNAPASVTTAFTATVTATSVSDATKVATLQIKVAPLPAITTTSFTATAGTSYNGALSESGGTSPYTFAITAGSLPAGLSLNSSTGAITGMPTGPSGNSSLTFQITDAAKISASQSVAVTVNAPPALTISTGSLPAGTTGTAYSQTLQATGGVPTYTWAVTTGSLPAGLTLNSATGAISGTPSGTFTGTTSFTVTATDSQTPTHATTTANLSITVAAPPLSVTTTSLAGGSIGNAYTSQTLQATGGISPYKWAVTTGSLPAGLSLNALTGVISGTPTGTFVGTVNFTVTTTDSETPTAKTATANLSIAISVAPLSVTTSGSLAVGVASSPYSGATLQATGGITPYSWTVTTGSLPAGLILNAATGAISGTPTTAAVGTANFTVTVTDSETPTAKTATANLSIVVNPALSVTTNSLPAGVIGTSYSQTLAAAGGITPYTWAITTGSLPTGLSLNTSTGAISGKPSGTFTGTVSFTVTVTDNESPTKQTASANLSIVISAPPLSVTTTSLAAGTIGNAYTNQTLQATGGITPYTWAITTGSLPSGLSLNAATGVISGTPTGTFVGTDSFTVTVTDSETPTGGMASANLSIAISVAPLSVTTTSSSLPVGVVSSVYAGATLQATGGITPYSWTVTTGSLPAGLTLNASTGAISGTPTASGTANFTVTVTDAETPTAKTATANLSIVVNPALSVTTTTLPAGVIGTTYPGATLAAAGGITPYTWAITTGSLPAGLSLNASTGAISGKPSGTLTGTVSFTVTVTDNESPTKQTASANLSIVISAPPLSVTTTSLAGGSIGTVYTNQTLQATGGITPYSWSVTTGSLPAGLSLSATTGVISGTPTGTFVGTDNFTVTVTDSETPTGAKATANLSITITVAPLSVTTTSSAFAVGVVNSVYPSTTLQATGGISPYSWTITTGSLPSGLLLNASTGVISGTPTASGTSNFTVTVTDSETPTAKTATANLSIVVNPALSVTTTTLAAGVIGTAYPGATLAAAGGITPYTWSVTTGSLPTGLSLNASTGAISGTPGGTFTGTVNFTVSVTDNESPTKQTASANLSIVISATPMKVTTTSLAGGSVGVVYTNQTLQATGGIAPYTWKVTTGSLPVGLSLNASTGVISGTPTGTFVGTDSFTVTATDSETPTGQTASANLSITITVAALTVTTTSSNLPVGVVSSVYPGATLQATGGITPYTWTVTTGSLPTGLLLNAATGAISGTPTASGTTNFTVTVTDSETPTAKTATANLSIVVNPALTVTTNSLAAGVIGTNYSQTLAATGGITPYTWAITTGTLPAGLSLNTSTGAISGTPGGTFTGTTNFTVTVTDNESPTKKTSSANLSITISAPTLKVTTTSLPTGVVNNSYTATVNATGGVQPYNWGLSGNPAWLSISSSTGVLSGTPTATGTYNFTVTVTDSETPTALTASANLSISVNNSAPLQVTTTGLPGGVVNVLYSTSAYLSATGGVQPYTWSYTGNLPPGITLNTSTGQLTGTPTSVGTFNFTAKVTDSSSPAQSATANLSITINGVLTITTTSVPNGSTNTQYNATVNAAGGLQPYSWSIISGSLPPGLNFNNNNTLTISGQPTTTGTYPFTLQVTDSENTSVSNSYTIVISTQPPGYTVSGNVTYSGSKTGWTYLQLTGNNNNCCGNNLGTSISEAVLTSGGAFTIHGVQPGTYTLQAFMDNLGYGGENASNPTGSVSNITVVNSPVTGVSIVLTDPAPVTLSTAPVWSGGSGNVAFNGGALVSFQTIKNNNGVEMPASYTVQWSTSSSFTTVLGSKSFPATGNNNPWIVNGLTNGQTLFFRAQGVAGSSTSNWSAPSNAITIGAFTGGNTVSGTVTFSETATGPLYVGFYDQGTNAVYLDVVGSKTSPPHSPAAYTVQVPTGSNYFFVGILDQNNSGLINGPGQVSNTNNNNNQAPVSITGNLTNENLTLPSGNSTATVQTQAYEQINSGGTNTYYNIGFNVNGVVKLPVAVELATGPTPGVVIPADIATGGFYGNSNQFSYWANLNGVTPQVGDTYTLNVTYSDGTSEILTVKVTAVLSAFATNLSPQGSGVSMTPNFNWTDPANASSYTYQFQLWDQNGNQIWQIPGNNSNSNGFSSSITSITWGVDPTGTGDTPSVSSLNGSSNYNWQITAKDVNGNSAGVQVTFQTAAAPLTLPAPGSVGSTVVGQSWSGAINASGGVGPNYTFTVNGATVPTDGTQVSLGDNLYAWNTGGNTLSLGGTPTAIQGVSFTVSVTDSASNTAGPYTYSISVTAAMPLTIQSTTLPGGDKGWLYNTSLQANGGVQPYTWSITSGTLPGGLSISNSNGNGNIAGTPTAPGTSTFTIMVTDSASETASASVSIVIGDCANNANLHGNYAFMLNGWKSSTDAQSTLGSFVADGAGNLSAGSLDISDQAKGIQSATFTGTYCVSSNNLVGISLTASGGESGTALLEGSLDSTGNGHIIRYDATSTEISSGLLRKQTTSAFATSKITGNYAFGFVGADQSSNRFGLAGQLNSNGSGTLTGSADYDDSCSGGSCSGNFGTTNLSASDFSVVSSTTGRGTVSMYVSAPNVTINFVFYVVSPSELLMMASDNTETPPLIMAGQVLQQSGTFTDASLNGISVIELQGVGNNGGSPQASAGFVTTNGAGTFSIQADQNQGGTMGTLCGTGTYSVASNGRMTLTSFTQCGGGGGGGHNPVFYLVAKNQAFVIGTDNSVTLGTMTPQVGSGFTAASLSGNYLGGSQETDDFTGKAQVIQLHADGAGNVTGTSDQNAGPNGCGGSCAGASSSTLAATYALYPGGPDGKFAIAQDGVTQVYIYMISTTQFVVLPVSSSDNQSNNPMLDDFHQ